MDPLGLDESSDLLAVVAQACDLCLKPWRHGVRHSGEPQHDTGDSSDCSLLIEARAADGQRQADRDLELEIYRSGDQLHLMLSFVDDLSRPVLWHGSHPVWMDAQSGLRCERPIDGAVLEAVCRRLRALLTVPHGSDDGGPQGF